MDVRMCPKCGFDTSRVYDVREQPDGAVVRRRECKKCKHRWQTIEVERWYYENLRKREGDSK